MSLHAHAEGGSFDDIELVPHGAGAALLFSDRSGTHVRWLDAQGRSRAGGLRLGTACSGGIAAASRGDSLIVACSRRADRDRGREGEIVLFEASSSASRILGRARPVGTESSGVDVVSEGARTVVGWRDADVFTARARAAELRDGELAARALSSDGTLASAPSLLVRDGVLLHAWTESWFDPGGRPSGHLLIEREGDPPRPSLDVNDIDVHVHLTADTMGPMVALRDRRPRSAEHHRSIVGRLDERMRLLASALSSPGRADGADGHPMLVPCGEHVFSVATRRSSRQVTMVSLRRLDRGLRPVEAEQQIYEYHARFPQAVGACVDAQLLVAVGEQQTHVSPVPRLRTFALRCGPGVAHERTPGAEGQVLRKRGAW